MNRRSVTTIIVSRGLDALLREALDRLERALQFARVSEVSSVIVVDNASPRPYLREEFARPGLELLRVDCHHGFAAANNLAARRAPNAFYFLLNNDVLLAEAALSDMFEVFEALPSVGVCGSRLLFPDGSIQHAGVVFGAGDTGPYHCHRLHENRQVSRLDRDFQAVTGACMLVRGEVWEALDGLCEDFGFGLEDIDFCLRARQLGWRVRCSNAVESLHFESLTPGRVERDVPSRQLFMKRWKGKYSIDG